MVCATARSGSNFLTDGLHATRRAGRPKQFFLPKFEESYGAKHELDPLSDYAGYVRGIVSATATSNSVFGFKVMGWYLSDFLARLAAVAPTGLRGEVRVLAAFFPRLSFVRVVRRNKLRQAISKARALQSGLWKVQPGNAAIAEPKFDPDQIARCLEETRADEAVWDDFFDRNAICPHTVIYEDLCSSYDSSVRGVLNFLNIRLRDGQKVEPLTVRQSDALSRDWERRFLELQPTVH
jgi:trehalose 2-sulfotransferase